MPKAEPEHRCFESRGDGFGVSFERRNVRLGGEFALPLAHHLGDGFRLVALHPGGFEIVRGLQRVKGSHCSCSLFFVGDQRQCTVTLDCVPRWRLGACGLDPRTGL